MADQSKRTPPQEESVLDRLKSSFESLPPKGDPGRRKFHFSLWYFLMALLVLSLVHDYFIARQINTISYSQFKEHVREGKVDKLTLKPQQVTGILKSEAVDGRDQPFVAVRVEDPELVSELDERGIQYTGRYENKWLATILAWAETGRIAPHVGGAFSITEFREAMRAKWSSAFTGGCVLHP